VHTKLKPAEADVLGDQANSMHAFVSGSSDDAFPFRHYPYNTGSEGLSSIEIVEKFD